MSFVTTIQNTIPTGSILKGFWSAAPAGWLLVNGGTVGNAASAATLYASDDALAIYTHLWDNLANAQAAVSGGRGASAAADFAANKTITMPDSRQKFAISKAASGSGSTMGGTGGNIDHTHQVTTGSQAVGILSLLSSAAPPNQTITSTASNPPYMAFSFIIKT